MGLKSKAGGVGALRFRDRPTNKEEKGFLQ